MFRKLSMAAIGELRFDAQRNSVADCKRAQASLPWMVLSIQPSLQTSLALWRPWFSRSSDSLLQARLLCRAGITRQCAHLFYCTCSHFTRAFALVPSVRADFA